MTVIVQPKRKYLSWVVKRMKGGENAAPLKKRSKGTRHPNQRDRVMHILPSGKVRMRDA